MIRILALYLILLLSPLPALAASFTATVDNRHPMAWEGITLQLNLTGAQQKGNPDTSALAQAFDIVGEGQTSETSIINGAVSSSVGWQLTLMPKHGGHVIVPPVAIDTDAGRLTTKPVELEIGESSQRGAGYASAQSSSHADDNPVTVAASVSVSSPYQNQPVIYSVRVTARASVSDLALGDVSADGAIVQPEGKPEVTDGVENGEPVKYISFRYILTPVQAKEVTIAPIKVRGAVESAPQAPRMHAMPNGFMDPFAMFQAMGMGRFPGFAQTQPFTVTGNPVRLEVKPPAAAMEPWLPLKDLQISETTDFKNEIRVGEPIIRKFILQADGIGGSQLPDLDVQQASPGFKVYADKPVTQDMIDKNTGDIMGRREESFSLIPTKPGRLILPAVKLPWWDIRTDRIAYAEAPAHTVDVLPAAAGQTNTAPSTPASEQPGTPAPEAAVQKPQHVSLTVGHKRSAVIGLALGGVALLIFAGYLAMRRRRARVAGRGNDESFKEMNTATPPVRQKPVVPDWNNILTAFELNQALLFCAQSRWNLSSYQGLEAALPALRQSLPQDMWSQAERAIGELNDALYGGKAVNIESMKAAWRELIAALADARPKTSQTTDKLSELNPT